MRRLLLVALLALAPAVPAQASPAQCVVTSGFPVCAGNCFSGETVTVRVVGVGSGTASCGGATASCTAFRGTCTGSDRATSSGALSCGGSALLVSCSNGPNATAR